MAKVRTTKIDVSALMRATPLNSTRSRSGGGGGSFGLGLAPAVTGFVWLADGMLQVGVSNDGTVARFKVDQPGATFELVDDANGAFYILMDNDAPFVDGDGYCSIIANDVNPAVEDTFAIIIRVSVGAGYADFTRSILVEQPVEQPFFYEVDASTYVFSPDGAQGDPICTFVPTDERLTLGGFIIVDGPAGIFEAGGSELNRSYGTPVAGQSYTVDLRFFLTGDGSDTGTPHDQTLTFDCVADDQ